MEGTVQSTHTRCCTEAHHVTSKRKHGCPSPSRPESFKPSSDDVRRETRLRPCTSSVQDRYQLDSTPHDGKARDSSGHDHFGDLIYVDNTAFLVKLAAEAVSSLNGFTVFQLVLKSPEI